ncbi:MAG: hypothetical protein HON98_11445 [Chloroflexi bacterium]|jgi:hypothetical protein|nr:hypothetical protein [Chloroflexota bacterium]MBT3670790.1 hypothetical protein [Chloroflexota bacterium]MBT4002085.1 hypothetical protein [Chloroflexota bacterium]MBT4305599.1 hypothetical protein [Chloroflexota bacterium]MBT4533320.1 hypothetical protein [Chloroflexota bacterium]
MEKLKKIKPFLPYILIFSFAVVARLVPGPRSIDDSFITFRYARNILAGEGFVYNPGEQVLGTTTPLYTLAMSGLGFISGGINANFPQIAMVINALLDGFSTVFLLLIGKKIGAHWAGIGAAIAWSIAPWSVSFAIGGMETSLYIFLLLGAWTAYIYQYYSLTSLAAAFAILTRPEALALVLPLMVDRLFFDVKRRENKITIKEFLYFIIPLLLWFSFSYFYFGSFLPQSIAAKTDAYLIAPNSALVRFLQHYSTPFMEQGTFGISAIYFGFVFYPTLFLIGSYRILKKNWAYWPAVLFPIGYAVAFSFANPLIFRWYLSPPLPFFFIFVLFGLESLITDIFGVFKKKHFIKYFAPLLIIFLPFLLLLNNWTLKPDHGLRNPAPEMAWNKLELLYTKVGKELALEIEMNPDAVLAAGDVGALGYFSNADILDTVGLISPQALNYYPLAEELYSDFSYAISPELILKNQPDYFVALEVYIRSGLLNNKSFLNAYSLINKIETDIYGSEGLLIFKRNKIR